MKLLGCLLILSASGSIWKAWKTQIRRPLDLAEAISCDLLVLKGRVCRGLTPLPQILTGDLAASPAAEPLWDPLAKRLHADSPPPLPKLWRESLLPLPQSLVSILIPLGSVLREGGESLAKAIDETREELNSFIQSERLRLTEVMRLRAAVCASSALLMILILI